MPFQRVKSVRLYEAILTQVRGLIEQGHIRVGDRFPPERTLQQQLGVSRPVLREAFRVMEALGWVESRPGGARYLTALPEVRSDGMHDEATIKRLLLRLRSSKLLHLWEARSALEARAVRHAAQHATLEQLEQMRSLVGAMDTSTLEEYRQQDYSFRFHLLLGEMSGNPVIAEMLKLLLHRLRELEFSELVDSTRWRQLCREHAGIYEAVRDGDGDRASVLLEEHFEHLRETLVREAGEA